MTPSSLTTPELTVGPRLARLLQPREQVEIDHGAGASPPEWLRATPHRPDGTAGAWRLLASARVDDDCTGETIERFETASGSPVEARRRADGTVFVPFDVDEAYASYVTEAWRDSAKVRALSSGQLRVYYRIKRLLPREFWLSARRAFIRMGRLPEFPRWPYDGSVDSLLRFFALCHLLATGADEGEFAWFWPGTYRATVILTHDVESAVGLRLALELADLEEERGLRSSFNVVGDQYEVDEGILRDLAQRGFEIGLHGLYHDRSLFSSREEFERQLPKLADAAHRFGALGFRSPATYRVSSWLPDLPVEYDCSVPHSDPYEPQPGGCCSIWPFMLGRMVELPYTLPQDHTLLTLLRKRSAEPWLDQVDRIEERFGLIQCLSHPDPGYLGDADKRAIYRDFLDGIVERRELWHALPREVAAWWRQRDEGRADVYEQRYGTMRASSGHDYVALEPPTNSGSSSPIGQ